MRQNVFRDKVVIVTGASAGIGRAISFQLAHQGAKVVIAARRTERLRQIADIQPKGDMIAVPTDVSDQAQCKALIEKTVAAFGRLDMLINNAGMAVVARFDAFPDLHLFHHVMDVNFYGSVYCTYYALPYLKRTQGRVVGVSSTAGKAALPHNAPYCASKHALHGFYDALRMELSRQGVSVTVICPWWVVTEMHEAQLDSQGIRRGPQGRSIYTNQMMTADLCAKVVLKAAYKRRREVLMGPGILASALKVFAPSIMDWVTVNIFIKSIIRRTDARKANAR